MTSSRNHLLLLLFGTILLVQSSFGKGLPLDETTTALETADVTTRKPIIPQIPGNEFIYFILSEFSKVVNSTLKIGKKLLEDTIAEISAQNKKNRKATQRLEDFSVLVIAIENLYHESDIDFDDFLFNFESVENLIHLLEEYKITKIDKPTETDQLFAKALENNGLNSYEKLFEKKFSEIFSNEFYTAAKRILDSSSTEEWPEKKNAQEWLEKINAENDVNEKFEIFKHFYDFFD